MEEKPVQVILVVKMKNMVEGKNGQKRFWGTLIEEGFLKDRMGWLWEVGC